MQGATTKEERIVCPADAVPDIENAFVDKTQAIQRAYFIWKKYGSNDGVSNYYQAEKELRMESRLQSIFRILDTKNTGECTFKQLLEFGNFIGEEWTLLYLRESFDLYDATESTIVNCSQFVRFCINELNGLNLTRFNYLLEGFIAFNKFDYRMKEEMDNCFKGLASFKGYTVGAADFSLLAEYLCSEKPKAFHYNMLNIIDKTRDGYISRNEFFILLALLLPININVTELIRRHNLYCKK